MECTVYAVHIFLMQYTIWEVYYNKIASFQFVNICPYQYGVCD
jgi:hypothetical protein